MRGFVSYFENFNSDLSIQGLKFSQYRLMFIVCFLRTF